MTAIGITHWPALRNPKGQRVRTTWAKLVARLSEPRTCAVKLDLPGFALATFKGDRRSLANVEKVYAVGLDLDERVNWHEMRDRFSRSASFLHSTWSSTLSEPRARVFLLLSRPVNGQEYRLVYASVARVAERGGLVVDRAASDPSRLWFLPAVKHGAPFTKYMGEGPPVDVDAAIAAAPTATPYVPIVRAQTGGPDALTRARAYLSRCEPAVSGSGGHSQTFNVALRLVRGFALSTVDAFDLMASGWNDRCSPPWSERELRRKVEQAASGGRMAEGAMLERER